MRACGGYWLQWLLWVVLPFRWLPIPLMHKFTLFQGIIDAKTGLKGRGKSGGCALLMVMKRKLPSPSPSPSTNPHAAGSAS